MLFSEFKKNIESSHLLFEGCTIVAAVSGGADSICLLHLLCRLREVYPFSLFCAHINHMIREEADADATFVEKICNDWRVPFLLHKADVLSRAKKDKISVELAGREERYSFLKSINTDFIMTAHNKNDVAESIFLHLSRGCGLQGLCGISHKREDGIYRPMLNFSREQIEAYLIQNNISWREDATNTDTIYTRNKIRHEIIPRFLEINPSFLDAVSRLTDILEKENDYLDAECKKYSCITEENGMQIIFLSELEKMHLALQKRVISSLVDNLNDVNLIIELKDKQNGKRVSLSGDRIAEKEYDRIVLYCKTEVDIKPIKLPMRGTIQFGTYQITVGSDGMALPKKEYWVRTRKPGDTFSPEGMNGHKKIKDFFIEKKIPKRLRDEIPVFTYNNQIAAISDLRRDSSFVPEKDDTIKIKVIKTKF